MIYLVLASPQTLAYSASGRIKNIEHIHSIYESAYAILFLGAPHNVRSEAQLGDRGPRMLYTLMRSKVRDTEAQTVLSVSHAFLSPLKTQLVFFRNLGKSQSH